MASSAQLNSSNIINSLNARKWQSAASQIGQLSANNLQTISLASLGSAIPATAWQTSSDAYVKKYEVIETSEDLITLSCAWYRLRKNRDNTPYVGIATLLQRELFELVIPEDRVRADQIRDYYAQKILVWTLKDQRLSTYREDLKTFINDKSNKTTEKMLPLAYRLPEFYFYDTAFDDMVRDLNKEGGKLSDTYSLTPLKCFHKHRKTIKKNEYWLKDKEDHVYVINLMGDNPLLHMWEREFDHAEMLIISGSGVRKTRDNLHYIEFTKWTLG